MTRIRIGIRTMFAVTAFALAVFPLQAEGSALAGRWDGAIDIPDISMEISVEFSLSEEGAWKGSISIPSQGVQDLPLSDIVIEGHDVAFAIPGIPGDPVFAGTISGDGKEITGTFSQSGMSFPFSLERRAAAGF